MKKLISYALLLLLLAAAFMTDSPPPGWYQQSIPTNKPITDLYFIDSLRGWATISSGQVYDSAKIIATTNGGNNWFAQFMKDTLILNAIQFLDINTGYAAGGYGFIAFYKTTNGGSLWQNIAPPGFGTIIDDIFFINKDTGWIADSHGFGGLFKTTNGGINWILQLGENFFIRKLFFINRDTGWAGSSDYKLYRTTNSGINWGLQYTFTQQINDVYFFNRFVGVISSGISYRTTNGGFNWTLSNDGGIKLTFVNDSVGWAGSNFYKIMKTTTGGISWFRQTSPIFDNSSVFAVDSSKAWAGGTGLVKTSDGGGPPMGIIKSNITVSGFMLKQNYPNPFNGVTLIFFDLPAESRVDLKIYNILGEEVSELLDDEYFTAGSVQFGFNSDKEGLSSGVYFYRLIARPEDGKEIFIDTKKMILIK